MKWCVYKHVSPSGRVYIGISSNVNVRWSNKGRRYTTYNSIFKKVIEKYGWDNISHEILYENLTKEKAAKIERDLISHYKSLELSYNITDGGEGTLGRKASEKTREKIRKKAHGFSDKARYAALVSEKRREAAKANIKKAHLSWRGQHHSEETKVLMREIAKKRNMSKAVKAQALLKSKKVLVVSPSGDRIIYNSRAEAALALKSSSSNITRAIKKKIRVNKYRIYDYDDK